MHDPVREAHELREQLSSDKRRIAFLFGAGTSQAVGLPGIAALTQAVGDELSGTDKQHYDRLLNETGPNANVEHVLDKVRLCRELIGNSTNYEAGGLKGPVAANLDRAICGAIFKLIRNDPPSGIQPHIRFANWVRYIRREWPIEIFTTKMLGRLRDRRFDFLLTPTPYDGVSQDLHELVAGWIDHEHEITILDLAGVPSEIIDLVVGLLARVLFETMFWGRTLPGVGKSRPLLLVFEEAHTYLPSGEARFIQGYARRSVQRILKEGRKYGVGSILVSQRPSELDETILSQCGTFVSLRLTNSTDQGRVKSTVPDELSGLTNLLPTLRTGEALILGEAIQMPSRVRIDLVEPRPDSGDPNVSDLWSKARPAIADYARAVTAWRKQTAL